MKEQGDDRIKAATFFTTLVDFTEPGELGVFMDEQQLTALEKTMAKRGYLDGAEMAASFNLLRASDLIWSFMINNYLLGKDPFPFDLLYWNSDNTRMPAAMHSFYLRKCYYENVLVRPGGISLGGVPIDLTRIDLPVYWLSTKEDHIAPWKSTYAATQLYQGPKRFVVAGSGHIAGVVNPPTSGKYGYWLNDDLPADPETWYAVPSTTKARGGPTGRSGTPRMPASWCLRVSRVPASCRCWRMHPAPTSRARHDGSRAQAGSAGDLGSDQFGNSCKSEPRHARPEPLRRTARSRPR